MVSYVVHGYHDNYYIIFVLQMMIMWSVIVVHGYHGNYNIIFVLQVMIMWSVMLYMGTMTAVRLPLINSVSVQKTKEIHLPLNQDNTL